MTLEVFVKPNFKHICLICRNFIPAKDKSNEFEFRQKTDCELFFGHIPTFFWAHFNFFSSTFQHFSKIDEKLHFPELKLRGIFERPLLRTLCFQIFPKWHKNADFSFHSKLSAAAQICNVFDRILLQRHKRNVIWKFNSKISEKNVALTWNGY